MKFKNKFVKDKKIIITVGILFLLLGVTGVPLLNQLLSDSSVKEESMTISHRRSSLQEIVVGDPAVQDRNNRFSCRSYVGKNGIGKIS